LDKPRKQAHQVLKFLLVPPADHLTQMPQKATLLLPALAQFDVKALPD